MQNELRQPTKTQFGNFAEYVCSAHSWYKQVSLLEGAEFVFFFSQEAGKGYSEEHPRLHYGWKTTEEYRHRFGFLDYMYRFNASQGFERDGQASSFVPSDNLLTHCCVVLYPYVSHSFDMVASLMTEEYLTALNANINYPRHQAVLKWYQAYVHQEDEWYELSDVEKDIVLSWDEEQQIEIAEDLMNLPIEVQTYMQLKRQATDLYIALQSSELAKIKSVLAKLCELSETSVQVWW